MSERTFVYELKVVWGVDGCQATIDGDDSPIRGYGATPIEALQQLVACLNEWPVSGADRWLKTDAGRHLARMFGVVPAGGGAPPS
jgi:hypothetical protein